MAGPLYLTPGLPLPPGEHVFIAGQNGSGKTFLARRLLSTRQYIVVIDTKPGGTAPWPGFRLTSNPKDVLNTPGRWQFRPPREWSGPQFLSFFEAVALAGHWYVYLDEGHSFVIGNRDRIDGVNILLGMGRERGITVWFGSQRAVWVPTFVTSETKHTFCFYMKRIDDREAMADLMVARGRADPMYQRIMDGPRARHGFFYSSSEMRSALEFGAIGAT
jgi:hypothetical protein